MRGRGESARAPSPPRCCCARLRSGSNKNATYTAFREVGRAIRTIQLLRYLSDASLRRRVTAATQGGGVQQLLEVGRCRRHARRQRPP
ncbi:Tn3 family transposase [Streptomyces sp. NBC_01591]|uniref:Tn3 family transposase n=1 Tax=Streptomyces sp. NBC_01591 TaxID=2975888 RepID=UPI003FA36229